MKKAIMSTLTCFSMMVILSVIIGTLTRWFDIKDILVVYSFVLSIVLIDLINTKMWESFK